MKFLLSVIGALLVGGESTAAMALPDPAQVNSLPAVAAQYRTTATHDHKTSRSEWRYWRGANSVQREDLADRTGDLWERDGATLFHTLLFHADRRGIEFEQVDLQMTGADLSWEEHAQIISPELLSRLKLVKSARLGGVPYQDYAGKIGEVRWRVCMRTDLQLPMRIEQQSSHDRLRIELVEAHDLATAPWQPTSAQGYGMVDFADLGDHERDPFVLRVQAYLGIGHGHEH